MAQNNYENGQAVHDENLYRRSLCVMYLESAVEDLSVGRGGLRLDVFARRSRDTISFFFLSGGEKKKVSEGWIISRPASPCVLLSLHGGGRGFFADAGTSYRLAKKRIGCFSPAEVELDVLCVCAKIGSCRRLSQAGVSQFIEREMIATPLKERGLKDTVRTC